MLTALNLDGAHGTTLHMFAGLRDGRYEARTTAERILNNEDFLCTKVRLQCTDSLLIDEISMVSRHIITQLDGVLKMVRNNQLPFGGIHVSALIFFFFKHIIDSYTI